MIVLDYDETGAQTEEHQIRMMGEVALLTEGSDGALDPEAYERTVADAARRRLGPGDHPQPAKAPGPMR
jgi:NitT/TauT family transport system substrate-binding protein